MSASLYSFAKIRRWQVRQENIMYKVGGDEYFYGCRRRSGRRWRSLFPRSSDHVTLIVQVAGHRLFLYASWNSGPSISRSFSSRMTPYKETYQDVPYSHVSGIISDAFASKGAQTNLLVTWYDSRANATLPTFGRYPRSFGACSRRRRALSSSTICFWNWDIRSCSLMSASSRSWTEQWGKVCTQFQTRFCVILEEHYVTDVDFKGN